MIDRALYREFEERMSVLLGKPEVRTERPEAHRRLA